MLDDPTAQVYTDPINEPDGPPGRTAAFQQGMVSGLQQRTVMFNSEVPKDYSNRSVLGNPDISSGIGLGQSDMGRRLYGGGLLPTFLGSSESTKTALLNKGIASKQRSA
jgi:hypothetical protein